MCKHPEKHSDCSLCWGHPGRRHDGYEDFGPCWGCDGTGCDTGCEDCDEKEEDE